MDPGSFADRGGGRGGGSQLFVKIVVEPHQKTRFFSLFKLNTKAIKAFINHVMASTNSNLLFK